ncbi:hypothetical protein F5Y12DRAFT_768968 [Xylaria sp. FL1777]|nr:hypothetical protein F5Y12DRAFT_768968 [Xylaria sp. FL1777]
MALEHLILNGLAVIVTLILALLSVLWAAFSSGVAVFILIAGVVIQYSSLGPILPPPITNCEANFANAIALASFNNTNGNTLDLRVLIEHPQPMIKYVSISPDVLPLGRRKSLRSNTAVINVPTLPVGNYTTAAIGVTVDGKHLTVSTSCDFIPGVNNVWHGDTVDILDLETIPTQWNTNRVKLVSHPDLNTIGNKAVLKFAEFGRDIESIDRETEIYKHLVSFEGAPQFIAHVTENRGSRVVGFLTEYIEGARSIRNSSLPTVAVEKCIKTLFNLHQLGIAHHNSYPRNCLLRPDGTAFLIDFEQAKRGEKDFKKDFALMNKAI